VSCIIIFSGTKSRQTFNDKQICLFDTIAFLFLEFKHLYFSQIFFLRVLFFAKFFNHFSKKNKMRRIVKNLLSGRIWELDTSFLPPNIRECLETIQVDERIDMNTENFGSIRAKYPCIFNYFYLHDYENLDNKPMSDYFDFLTSFGEECDEIPDGIVTITFNVP
jgi:hypothetical protein